MFRTFNASKTLQEQLELLTNRKGHYMLSWNYEMLLLADDIVTSKLLSYNRANRAVAVLCNHQVLSHMISCADTIMLFGLLVN